MKILFVIAIAMFACSICFGQNTYQGVIPGKSTKPEAERAFGQPVRQVSPTLLEYKSPEAWGKFYIQYASGSPDAVVVRMELACSQDSCIGKVRQPLTGVLHDVQAGDPVFTIPFKQVKYYGAPRFAVTTDIVRNDKSVETRLAFYSKELFESAIPKGGCTGTIFGTWDTDRGRATFTRVGDNGVKGTYSKNNGTVSLTSGTTGYHGEWKDDTGSGTIQIELGTFSAALSTASSKGNKTFSGKLTPTSAASSTPSPSNDRIIGSQGSLPIGSILGALMESLNPNWTGTCIP